MHPCLRLAYLAFAEQLRVRCVAAARNNFPLAAPADRAAILDQLSLSILIITRMRPDLRYGSL